MADKFFKNKWMIMVFVVLTNMFNIGLASMAISVLSKEISVDLNLTPVQLGVVWGSGSTLSIVSSIFGGPIIDKVGARKIMIASTFCTGLLSIYRSQTTNFTSMVVVTTLIGFLVPLMILSDYKIFQDWFPSDQIVTANGLMSAGMALGFLLGSQVSGTLLSPLLGGWRNVLLLYASIGTLFAIPWFFVKNDQKKETSETHTKPTIISSLSKVLRIRNVWLLGFALFGVNGAVNGVLGYLPYYLRSIGWSVLSSSTALTTFHTLSMIFTMPIVFYSSRILARKTSTVLAATAISVGIALLAFLSGNWIWFAVVLAGFSRDGFMALFFTQVSETEGVGIEVVATASGLAMMLNGIGSIIAPPIGNYFVSFAASAPFGFWSLLSFCGVICLLIVAKSSTTKHNYVSQH